ncbi:MAG: hypothetical protein WAK48_02405 [Candidatus Acidiferrum sp.]|jgi:hypothetical protein
MAVLLSLDKAAEALGGISIWTLRKHIAVGNVRVTHLGRRVFLDEEEMGRVMREGLPSLRSSKTNGPVTDSAKGFASCQECVRRLSSQT